MANDNIIGNVVIILELPDGGILRDTQGTGATYHHKSAVELINEVIESGIAATDWSSDGMSGGFLSLTYDGGE